MHLKTTLFIIILCLSSRFNGYSQQAAAITRFQTLFEVKDPGANYSGYVKNSRNELQLVLSGVFIFYKQFFSSQDANKCVFYPSCSEYAIQSIQKKGFFTGILDSFDRLTRCNSPDNDHYPVNKETGRLYDPVE